MKFTFVATLTLVPALATAFVMRGPVSSPRFTSLRDCNGEPPRQRRVDTLFEDLKTDLREDSGRSSEENVAKANEWVDRSFDLFSDLNREVGSPTYRQKNEVFLSTLKKWVNRGIEFADELNRDLAPLAEDMQRSVTIPGPQALQTIERPSYRIKDEDKVFQVEMDLPGVDLSDINITFDEENMTLIVKGQRNIDGSDRSLAFARNIALDPSVDTDKITAELNNGILIMTVPKLTKEKGKQIPIMTN